MALEGGRPGTQGGRFVILSLPRCGSTSIARLLNEHSAIRCLVEPFHPRRYQGRYRTQVHDVPSLDGALESIWSEFQGIKHVWEAAGWPFLNQPEIEDRLSLGPGRKIVYLMRRNLLRRWVSEYVAQQTQFWIGTREEFRGRVDDFAFPPLDVEKTRDQLALDRTAMEHRRRKLIDAQADALMLYYEDVYREDATALERFALTNRILGFLNFAPVTLEAFRACFERHLTGDVYRWASPELYRRIPGIDAIEAALGSDENGWLFR